MSQKAPGTLPENGNVMPKHVEAIIKVKVTLQQATKFLEGNRGIALLILKG
jgi:hypothetical protein